MTNKIFISSQIIYLYFLVLSYYIKLAFHYSVEKYWWERTFLLCFWSEQKASSFSPLSMRLAVEVFLDVLYQVKEVPFYFQFSWNFYHEWVLDIIKCFFLHQSIGSCDFFFFSPLMWWISLIDFKVLNYPFLHGINPIGHGVYNSFHTLLHLIC